MSKPPGVLIDPLPSTDRGWVNKPANVKLKLTRSGYSESLIERSYEARDIAW